MKKIFSIIILFLLFSSGLIHSQVTVTISDVYVDTHPVTSGSAINIGTSSSKIIKFKVTVSKPDYLSLGSCQLSIGTYKSNGDYTMQFTPEIITYGSNNVGSTGIYEFELFDADMDFSNFCYLSAKLEQTSGTPPLNWTSNKIQIKKIPAYYLSQSQTTIDCGSTTPVIFNINSNAPLNVTYLWSFTNSWTLVNGTLTSSSIGLLQTNSNLSNVNVTPVLNGIPQANLSFTVLRNVLSSSASIAGNTTICIGNNGIYTISGLGAGNMVSWSSSNTAIATVSGGTQGQVTVNGLSQGLVNLIATVTNSCGQTAPPIIKPLNIGAPVMANGVIYGELWVRNNFPAQTLTFPAVLGATSYTWSISPSLDFPLNCPAIGAVSAKFSNNLQTITTTTPSATATFGNCLGDYLVNCTISNACGNSVAYSRIVTVGVSGTSPCNTNFALSKTYTLSQNPIKNGKINIKKISTLVIDNPPTGDDTSEPSIVAGDGPCYQEWPKIYTGKRNLNLKKSNSNSQIEVKVFDFFGKLVLTKTLEASKEEISIKDSYLKPGKYIIHINDGNSTQKEIIIIE